MGRCWIFGKGNTIKVVRHSIYSNIDDIVMVLYKKLLTASCFKLITAIILFQYNGKDITWVQLIRLFKENQPFFDEGPTSTSVKETAGVASSAKDSTSRHGSAVAPLGVLNPIPKITLRHLYLTPTMRMKVKLATQVNSKFTIFKTHI